MFALLTFSINKVLSVPLPQGCGKACRLEAIQMNPEEKLSKYADMIGEAQRKLEKETDDKERGRLLVEINSLREVITGLEEVVKQFRELRQKASKLEVQIEDAKRHIKEETLHVAVKESALSKIVQELNLLQQPQVLKEALEGKAA